MRCPLTYADVAELADAPDLGSGGRPWGFESLHPHKKSTMVFDDHRAFFIYLTNNDLRFLK